MGYIAEFNRVNAERTALTGDSGACIQKLHRELFYAWCFLAQEDLLDEEFSGHLAISVSYFE